MTVESREAFSQVGPPVTSAVSEPASRAGISGEKPCCWTRRRSLRQRARRAACLNARVLSAAAAAGAAAGAAAAAWSPARATAAAFGKQRCSGRRGGNGRVGRVAYAEEQRGSVGRGFGAASLRHRLPDGADAAVPAVLL